MLIKSSWLEYLHRQRKKEIDVIFSKCPQKIFSTVLELGCGDGFQSRLLSRYALKIIASDYNPSVLKNEENLSIEYCLVDAEEVDQIFHEKQFDLVFSSNLLEHLPHPGRALEGIYKILKDDGITIHVLPTPFWKLCHVVFHIPSLFITFLEIVTERGGWGKIFDKIFNSDRKREVRNNNPKTIRIKRSFLSRLFVPNPHGVSSCNNKEFYAFSSHRWKREFKDAGLSLIKILKGPVMSGYGFELKFMRNLFERLGVASVYVYIAIKNNHDSNFKQYFFDLANSAT